MYGTRINSKRLHQVGHCYCICYGQDKVSILIEIYKYNFRKNIQHLNKYQHIIKWRKREVCHKLLST